jgi:polyhydroxyalkanoate synthesis regulator phasin
MELTDMTATKAKKETKRKTPKATAKASKVKTNSKLTTVEGARERAEELLSSLQGRARELAEARQGLITTVTDLVNEKGLKPADVKGTLDDLLGRIKSNELWDELTASNTVATLSDYREELERQIEAVVTRIMSTLNIATRADLEAMDKKLKGMNRKVNELSRKVKTLTA